jgi:hypothetical protein
LLGDLKGEFQFAVEFYAVGKAELIFLDQNFDVADNILADALPDL